MRFLIIEDDKRLADNLSHILKSLGWVSDIAENAQDALELSDVEEYDLVILDWMLPDENGLIVCEKLRKKGHNYPILFLTSRREIEDKVKGLESGADDYLTKPFVTEEFLARIKALLRRKSGETEPVIKIADLIINTNMHQIKRDNNEIELAPREYSLLEYLAFNKGKALDRFSILNHVWGNDADEFSNTVDVHIRYLRKKIDDGFELKLIKTVKGKGYMICDD